jgi:hypothetical protein
VKVAAILLEPSTFGGEDSSLGVFASLAASDVYTYLVKRDDDLGSALGAAGETVEQHAARGGTGE